MTCFAAAKFFETDIATAIAALAAVITMAAAIIGLRYARREVSTARENARVELAFRLYEQQLDSKFAESMGVCIEFLSIKEQGKERERIADKRWAKFQTMAPRERTTLLLYLNHLEVVGGLYRMGHLDKKTAMHYFGAAASAYAERFEWFIERAQFENRNFFENWLAFAAAYNQLKRDDRPRHR